MNANEKIKHLSTDTAFGILTRPALEIYLSERKSHKPAILYILDLNNIHRLNSLFGYTEVNRKVKLAIKGVRAYHPHLVFGRIFSGDEIAVIDSIKRVKSLQKILAFSFSPHGLSFKGTEIKIYFGKSITYYSKFLNEMSVQLTDHHKNI